MPGRVGPGAVVLVHLAHPSEKLWGLLEGLDAVGLTLRGIGLDAFDDWVAELARGEASVLGLATQFVPLARVERVFLDEPVGAVESYCQVFERRVGRPVRDALGLDGNG